MGEKEESYTVEETVLVNVTDEKTGEVSVKNVLQNVTNIRTVPVYEQRELEGVLIDDILAKHEQAIYELKEENRILREELCMKDKTYSFC